MADHDKMLEQGPREAPEPETAEERSRRLGWKSGAGAAAGGGLALAKFSGLAKVLFWLFIFHGAVNSWRIGSWVGLAVAAGLAALFLVRRARKEG